MKIDLSGSIDRRLRRVLEMARAAAAEGEPRTAAARWLEAADLHKKLAAYSATPSGSASAAQRAAACHQQARALLAAAERHEAGGARGAAGGARAAGAARRRHSHGGEEDDPLDTHGLRARILSLIGRSSISWRDIGGLAETKQRIQAGVGLMMARAPEGVKLPRSRMLLLEGPPGTGKTLLAAAVAGQLEATFFDVKASQLMSRYFGDSPRLVSLLFEEARAHAPAVIFLDEFEALAAARSGEESGVERRVLATLLAELDGVAGKSDETPVLTLAATNVPQRLDPAILSRFSSRIEVPLPDEAARAEIFRIHLQQAGYECKVAPDVLVSGSEGFSGRDIKQLCTLAIEAMLLRANPHLLAIGARDSGEPKAPAPACELRLAPVTEDDLKAAAGRMKAGTAV